MARKLSKQQRPAAIVKLAKQCEKMIANHLQRACNNAFTGPRKGKHG